MRWCPPLSVCLRFFFLCPSNNYNQWHIATAGSSINGLFIAEAQVNSLKLSTIQFVQEAHMRPLHAICERNKEIIFFFAFGIAKT